MSTSREKLRTSKPAPTTTITARAISVMTSPLRKRSRPEPGVALLPPSLSERCTSAPANRSTGASPNSTPVRRVLPSVKRKTLRSKRTSSRRGRFSRPSAIRKSMPKPARNRPTTAPVPASTRLSVSICRLRRTRPAPIAVRTAISRPRSDIRAKRRLVTFAQAISSRSPVAPNKMNNGARVSPTTASCKGISVVV